MSDNFEKIYGELIEDLTSRIKEESVEYISISTFRCPYELMNIIRQRKNPSILTKGDFIKGIDGKTRYFKAERIKMIHFVTKKLKKGQNEILLYIHNQIQFLLLLTAFQEQQCMVLLYL